MCVCVLHYFLFPKILWIAVNAEVGVRREEIDATHFTSASSSRLIFVFCESIFTVTHSPGFRLTRDHHWDLMWKVRLRFVIWSFGFASVFFYYLPFRQPKIDDYLYLLRFPSLFFFLTADRISESLCSTGYSIGTHSRNSSANWSLGAYPPLTRTFTQFTVTSNAGHPNPWLTEQAVRTIEVIL